MTPLFTRPHLVAPETVAGPVVVAFFPIRRHPTDLSGDLVVVKGLSACWVAVFCPIRWQLVCYSFGLIPWALVRNFVVEVAAASGGILVLLPVRRKSSLARLECATMFCKSREPNQEKTGFKKNSTILWGQQIYQSHYRMDALRHSGSLHVQGCFFGFCSDLMIWWLQIQHHKWICFELWSKRSGKGYFEWVTRFPSVGLCCSASTWQTDTNVWQ